MTENTILVSVIVPCRNERGWIVECLESIVRNDFPHEQMEILVVDGMSDDGTTAMIEDFAGRHPFVRLIQNPRKITPTALNLGIAAARGKVILRMDAHVEYPADYISSLVRLLDTSGADNVGGVCNTRPDGAGAMARAIAAGMSHPLGVGNSHFRIGSASERWVDTVPFGCYRKEVFDRIGVFDEELVRNQDDELNLRLIRQGGKILLTPKVVSIYYARNSLRKLWRMYYQYGYFKPLVVRKVRGVMTMRQLAPPALVLAFVTTCLLAPWSFWGGLAFAAVAGSYGLAVLAGALTAIPKHGLAASLGLCLVFPTMHFSYGIGYLRGLVDFFLLRRNPAGHAQAVPISR